MKKIAFVLAVLLLAAPTWAASISAVQVPDTNQVEIRYDFSGENLPRAFGLDITVTAGIIVICTPAHIGECDDVSQGYGIFPGTIVIEADGTVSDYNTPVAPSDDPGALGGLGTAGITVEMGSLYEDTNAPADSGVLCTIVVTENCTVEIAGNAARCGEGSEALGVVMENPDEVVIPTYIPGDVVLDLDCFIIGNTYGDITVTAPMYALWVSIGKPYEWCCESNSKGDADLDGWTNANDVGPIINALGQQTDATNYLADLDRDGWVNANDVGPIINHLGENVGPCPNP